MNAKNLGTLKANRMLLVLMRKRGTIILLNPRFLNICAVAGWKEGEEGTFPSYPNFP